MTDTPYDALTPDVMLDAIDAHGCQTDGTLTALNSYENRVYQVGINDDEPIIAKFYRPERWSVEAILEEHAFTLELAGHDLPCVAPMVIDGETLFTEPEHGYRFALFPRRAGHPPNIEDEEVLGVMGRTLGRLHAVGRVSDFAHRPTLTPKRLGHESREFLLSTTFVPPDLEQAYATTTAHLLTRIDAAFEAPIKRLRIHGDCHLGNLLWRYDAPNFVDFDDTVMGPAIQDLWMLLSGEREEQEAQLSRLINAYHLFCDFDPRETMLIEPLRTLRMIHHAAWIGRRWNDPAFPIAFPWFDGEKYWSDHVLSLREQMAKLDEPPLAIY